MFQGSNHKSLVIPGLAWLLHVGRKDLKIPGFAPAVLRGQGLLMGFSASVRERGMDELCSNSDGSSEIQETRLQGDKGFCSPWVLKSM